MIKKGWRQTLAVVSFVLAAVTVQAGQVLVAEHSEIRFVGKQMGVPASGQFQKFTADVAVDLAAMDKSRIRVVITMNSVTLPAADLTTEVKRKRWFDTENFPEATFESKQFRTLGDGHYQVEGTLKLKGVAKEITVPLTLKPQGTDLTAEGQFEIKRLDFNIGDGQWADTDTVANEVQIKFKLLLKS